MKLVLLALALAAALAHGGAHAQTALVAHELGYGVRLSLPATWVLASARERAANLQGLRESLRTSGLKELREAVANTPVLALLQARGPGQPVSNAMLAVVPESTMEGDEFDNDKAGATAELVAATCESFKAQMAENGGSGTCLPHEILKSNRRTAVVLHQDAVIPGRMNNRRTVMMIPAKGLFLTLSVSLPNESYDPALVRAILDSIVLPPEI